MTAAAAGSWPGELDGAVRAGLHRPRIGGAASGARLIGIDLDEAALAAARHRADQAEMAGRASFRRGSFSDSGLPDGSPRP